MCKRSVGPRSEPRRPRPAIHDPRTDHETLRSPVINDPKTGSDWRRYRLRNDFDSPVFPHLKISDGQLPERGDSGPRRKPEPRSPQPALHDPKTDRERLRHRSENDLKTPLARPRKDVRSLPNLRTDFGGSSERGGPGPSTQANRSLGSPGVSFNTRDSPKSPTPSRYKPHTQRSPTSPGSSSTPSGSRSGQPSPSSTAPARHWSFQVEGSNTRVYARASPKGKGKLLRPMSSVTEQDLDVSTDSARAESSKDRDERDESLQNDDTAALRHDDSAQGPSSH